MSRGARDGGPYISAPYDRHAPKANGEQQAAGPAAKELGKRERAVTVAHLRRVSSGRRARRARATAPAHAANDGDDSDQEQCQQ